MQALPMLVACLGLVAVGIFAVVFGGADDSPGLQLIGVVLVLLAGWLAVRTLRRPRP